MLEEKVNQRNSQESFAVHAVELFSYCSPALFSVIFSSSIVDKKSDEEYIDNH